MSFWKLYGNMLAIVVLFFLGGLLTHMQSLIGIPDHFMALVVFVPVAYYGIRALCAMRSGRTAASNG